MTKKRISLSLWLENEVFPEFQLYARAFVDCCCYMFWANFLHFYQPSHQQRDILERIVNESYRPLVKILLDNPQAKVSININGGLLDLFRREGYTDLIENLCQLLGRNQIELTGSAKYHAFLPLLPQAEAKRQIQLNEESFREYWGKLWDKKGFFSPELAYDFDLAKMIEQMGYTWMVAPQIAYGAEVPRFDKIYQIKGLEDFRVYFRHKQASVLILSGITRSVESFLSELGIEPVVKDSIHNFTDANGDRKGGITQPVEVNSEQVLSARRFYLLTIMDAETFGHHRPGLEKLLAEFMASDKLQMVKVSDLPSYFPEVEEVEPRASTWSNEEQDFWLDKERKVATQNPFLLWKDPANPIHRLQWEFTDWLIGLLRSRSERNTSREVLRTPRWQRARDLLDQVLASDQFWWASAKPWWSLEMIEAGAWQLREVVRVLCGLAEVPGENPQKPSPEVPQALLHSEEWLEKAEAYYRKILDQAFEWQRTGKIRQAHRKTQGDWREIPFKKRAPAEWYNQVILEFEDEMRKSAEKLEFEKAIKWRDAIIKLKAGTDIYDVLHVVDELHTVRKIPSLRPFLKYREDEISEFAKEHLVTLPSQKKEGELDSLRS